MFTKLESRDVYMFHCVVCGREFDALEKLHRLGATEEIIFCSDFCFYRGIRHRRKRRIDYSLPKPINPSA
jgi:hypothetical protein